MILYQKRRGLNLAIMFVRVISSHLSPLIIELIYRRFRVTHGLSLEHHAEFQNINSPSRRVPGTRDGIPQSRASFGRRARASCTSAAVRVLTWVKNVSHTVRATINHPTLFIVHILRPICNNSNSCCSELICSMFAFQKKTTKKETKNIPRNNLAPFFAHSKNEIR